MAPQQKKYTKNILETNNQPEPKRSNESASANRRSKAPLPNMAG